MGIYNRRLAYFLLCIIFSIAGISHFNVSTAHADWRDKFKLNKNKSRENNRRKKVAQRFRNATNKAKSKWRRTAPKIRSATDRARSQWKRTTPKLRSTANKAKRQWKMAAPKIRHVTQSARNKYKEYSPKIHEAAKNTHERIGRYGPKLKQAAAKAKGHWDTLKPKVKEARIKAENWYIRNKEIVAHKTKIAIEQYGPAIQRTIRDPENQKKAFETIGAMLEMRRQLKGAQRESIYRAITFASKLSIPTNSGTRTLGDMAKERLVSRFPGLAGTDIVEDPAAPITALLTSDRKYFLTECKVVKSGNMHVSITQAISDSSSFDTDKAMKCLELMEATESVSNAVTTGEGSLDAMEKAMGVMESLGK